MTVERIVHPDADTLATDVARRIERFVADRQADGREPHLVLTGGTIAVEVYERFTPDGAGDGGADWSRVHLWWGDERFVPLGHEDRNDQQARDAFIDRLSVPADHVHAMPAQGGSSASIADAADAYGAALPDEAFDLLLLGLGPDGHVASLFPGFAQLVELDRPCVEVFDSPKPPTERITLTFPALNRSQEVWFLVSGEGKAEAAARAAADGPIAETPAKGVHGLQNTRWFLDEPAASQL